MLGLLEIFKLENGVVQSLDLTEKYKEIPSVKVVLDAAKEYVSMGYAEVYGKNGLSLTSGELNAAKNYTIKWTPAGKVLAKALPPLIIALPLSDNVGYNGTFWGVHRSTLNLLPRYSGGTWDFPEDRASGKLEYADIAAAREEYEQTNLIVRISPTRILDQETFQLTEAGRTFGAAIVEAEKMVFKQRNPVRVLFRMKRPPEKVWEVS
jgi:hypothetical protein